MDPRLVVRDPEANAITEAPRNVAKSVPGLRVIELPRNRDRGLCCGGGGGHMWMEVKAEKRVNIIRTEELLETGATIAGTACPFCLAMVDLGRKVKEAEEAGADFAGAALAWLPPSLVLLC